MVNRIIYYVETDKTTGNRRRCGRNAIDDKIGGLIHDFVAQGCSAARNSHSRTA